MTVRQVVFWVHLAIGVTAALIVLMMAVTGVILTFEAQLNGWALGTYRANPPAGVAPLAIDTLVARAAGAASEAVTAVTVRRDPREPAVVELDGGMSAYLDRYTGRPLGDGETPTRRVLRAVMHWHRWFGLEGSQRIIGRTFTATANLGFLFLIVSGLYLWWPRAWTRATLRQAMWFRSGLRGRARHVNWHSVIGLWLAVPLAVIVASGATMSYRWAGDLVYRVVGESPPAGSPFPPPTLERIAVATPTIPPPPPSSLQALLDAAAARGPGWRSLTVHLPASDHAPVVVTIDRGTGHQPSRREDLLLDQSTTEVVGHGGYPTYSRGLKLRRWLRFAHTGEVYGVVGQAVAGLASLGAAVIAWTGLAMGWRRLAPQVAMRVRRSIDRSRSRATR